MENSHNSSNIAARIREEFPEFAESIVRWDSRLPFEFGEPMSDNEIADLESDLGVRLPESYKRFLRLFSKMEARHSAVHIGYMHFFHDRDPGKGMLCIGDFNMLADGDQILLDTTQQPVDGEYNVLYYDHEASPPCVTKLAGSFSQFLAEFMDYEDWGEYEDPEQVIRHPTWRYRLFCGLASLVSLAMLILCLTAVIRNDTWHWKSVLTSIFMPTFLIWLTLFYGVPALTGIELKEAYERWKQRRTA